MNANKKFRFYPPLFAYDLLQYLIVSRNQEGKRRNTVVDISYPITTGVKLSPPRLSSLLVP